MSSLLLHRLSFQKGYDHKTCWVHARCGVIPPSVSHPDEIFVMTMQKLLMGDSEFVSDIFQDLASLHSLDGGRTWTDPQPEKGLAGRVDEHGIEHVVCDFSSQYHRGSGRLLGIGATACYRDKQATEPPCPQRTPYSTYSRERECWTDVRELGMPNEARFFLGGAGCVQWEELANGDLLLPIYHRARQDDAYFVSVLRCAFDGEELEIREVGPPMSLPVQRGLVEPSLTFFGDKFWLTLRNDEGAYFCHSADGLHFEEPRRWRFDNGEVLGSENTQQHWARVGQRLYLVYTRAGLDNDHVFRHRAPLLIAEVDPVRGCLIRRSEQILVPERGAGLGNFGVCQSNPAEALVCASEWMENTGRWNPFHWSALEAKFPSIDLDELASSPGRSALCELSGSDNSIHLVKLTEDDGGGSPLV